MDDSVRIAELEIKVRTLTQQIHQVDCYFRSQGWPPVVDEQLAAINVRKDALAQGRAA